MKPLSLGRPGINFFIREKILALLLVFLLIFPKGGVKLLKIPVTWGYLSLGALFIFALFRKKFLIQTNRLMAFILLLPFVFLSTFTIAINGAASPGMTLSFFISFFFLPCLFLILLSEDFEKIDLEVFFRLFKGGILFIALYGIALFFIKLMTGKFLEIPFLTVNYGDLGELEGKCIDRGKIFKLISTYNNGNIYGISLLILFPLYRILENKMWKKTAVILSLVLTISRTVWIGLIATELLHFVFLSKKNSRLLPYLIFSSLGIFILMKILDYRINFLLDPSLGGRRSSLDLIGEAGLVSHKPFGSIGEIVYVGIVDSFGWLGLIAFILGITAPLLLLLKKRLLHKAQKAIASGLIVYLFISLSDGAILYIPVMAFYWAFSSLLFRKDWAFSSNCPVAP